MHVTASAFAWSETRRARLALALLAIAACGGRANGPSAGPVSGARTGALDATGSGTMSGSGTTGGAPSGASISGGADATAGEMGGSTSGFGNDAAEGSVSDVADAGTSDASDASAIPPSCASGGPGTTNCGATLESCCTSPLVTGGTFDRTYDLNPDGGPYLTSAEGGFAYGTDPATVSTLRLDKYPVTVGRFRQFVRAWNAGWLPAAGSGKHAHLNNGSGLYVGVSANEPGWATSDNSQIAPTDVNLACNPYMKPYSTWTGAPGTQETLPINCVNWYEAYAFCIWDGAFLPSKAEWAYAAAGGDEQRLYPWGWVDPGSSNHYAIYGCLYPNGPSATALVPGEGVCTGLKNIPPVGTATLGAGRWGQLDLTGEVAQWTVDDRPSYYTPCPDCAYEPCADCASIGSPGGNRAFARGDFGGQEWELEVPSSLDVDPASWRANNFGLRCARVP